MFKSLYDNKENTYYLSNISNTLNKIPYVKDKYRNEVGYFGNKLIETPYLSDDKKLDIIEMAKPEYSSKIQFMKKTLPYIKKASEFNNEYLTNKNKETDLQYKLHSNIINTGGKTKKKYRFINKKTKRHINKKYVKKYVKKSKKKYYYTSK